MSAKPLLRDRDWGSYRTTIEDWYKSVVSDPKLKQQAEQWYARAQVAEKTQASQR